MSQRSESNYDSWKPKSNLAGAKELLKKFWLEHNIGSKPKSAQNSTISNRSTRKSPCDAEEDKQPDTTAKKTPHWNVKGMKKRLKVVSLLVWEWICE